MFALTNVSRSSNVNAMRISNAKNVTRTIWVVGRYPIRTKSLTDFKELQDGLTLSPKKLKFAITIKILFVVQASSASVPICQQRAPCRYQVHRQLHRRLHGEARTRRVQAHLLWHHWGGAGALYQGQLPGNI